jgi:hypothetical protein
LKTVEGCWFVVGEKRHALMRTTNYEPATFNPLQQP